MGKPAGQVSDWRSKIDAASRRERLSSTPTVELFELLSKISTSGGSRADRTDTSLPPPPRLSTGGNASGGPDAMAQPMLAAITSRYGFIAS